MLLFWHGAVYNGAPRAGAVHCISTATKHRGSVALVESLCTSDIVVPLLSEVALPVIGLGSSSESSCWTSRILLVAHVCSPSRARWGERSPDCQPGELVIVDVAHRPTADRGSGCASSSYQRTEPALV